MKRLIMKENTKANLAFLGCIASIIAIVLIFCQIWTQCNPIQQHTTSTTTDTVYVNKYSDTLITHTTDTLWKEKTIVKTQLVPTKITPIANKASGEPIIAQTTKYSPDTSNVETAQLAQQISQYEWQGTDSTNNDIKINYYIKATGKDITMDTLRFTTNYAQLHNNELIKINNTTDTYKSHNETTMTMQTKKQSRFNFSIGVGAGYGIINKKPDIFVGGTLGIRLF